MPDGLSDGESAVYMKLLFVHQHLGAWGGAEANIQTTARELVRRGHTVALAHAEMTGRGVETAREAFSECFQLPSADTKAAVAAFVRRFEPDLIYLHHLQDLDVFEQLLETGIPVVRMVHDHSLYCLRSYKYNPLTRKICTRAASVACVFPCLGTIQRNRGGALPVKWASYSRMRKEMRLTGQCRRLVAYSEHSRNELVRNGFAANKILLHVPLEMPAEETITPSFSERNLIVFAGQVIRGKGVDLLLKALSKVSVPFECHILGDGSHRAACERLADKLGLGSRVRFEGFIPAAELHKMYADASMLVVSSVWPEPFGLVGPEAMRYGLPVVAFDAGGIREWLLDRVNGFLAPWADTDAFAARVEQLLRNKTLAREMGRRGKERVLREYAVSLQVENLENLFLEVVRETPVTVLEKTAAGCAATLEEEAAGAGVYLHSEPAATALPALSPVGLEESNPLHTRSYQ